MPALILGLTLLFMLASPAQAEVINVSIKAMDDGVKTSQQQDYKEAVLFAKRQALEKAGVEMKSSTTIRNYIVDEDVIESRSEGVLLPDYQIHDVGYDANGNYVVVLTGQIKVLNQAKTAKGDAWVEVSNPEEVFEQGYFQAVGQSAPGQDEAMAKLAARLMAQARLLEVVNGLGLSRTMAVKRSQVDKDEIQAEVEGYISQSSICGEEYNEQDKSARVCMRLYLKSGRFGDLVYEMVSDKVRK